MADKTTTPPTPVEDIIQYLKDQENNHNPIYSARVMYYDKAIREKNDDDHLKLVMAVLKIWNPNWNEQQYNLDSKGKTIDLGNGLHQLTYRQHANTKVRNWDITINLLGTLDIQWLDLSNSDFYDFESLRHLNLDHLNISNTSISKLNGIKHFKNLKVSSFTMGNLAHPN